MSKINLGCGNLPLEGFKNIDKSLTAKADEFYDITNGLQELSDSIDEINAGCVLEQLTHEQFMFVLNECYRVLKQGGTMTGYVPSTDPRVLHLDPADKLFFQEGSFDYLDRNKHAWREFGHNYGFSGWEVVEVHTNSSGIIFFTLRK